VAVRPPRNRRSTPKKAPGHLLASHRKREKLDRLRRVRSVACLTIAAVITVSGCAPERNDSSDVADQGYQSGGGTTQTWPAAERGEPVTLKGTDYEGNPVETSAWLGDVVVLNTWYAACPPCRKEAPDLVAVSNDYAERGVHVLGINRTDAAGTAQAFQRKLSVPYPSIKDIDSTAITALSAYVPVQAVPTTVVLDPEGPGSRPRRRTRRRPDVANDRRTPAR